MRAVYDKPLAKLFVSFNFKKKRHMQNFYSEDILITKFSKNKKLYQVKLKELLVNKIKFLEKEIEKNSHSYQ